MRLGFTNANRHRDSGAAQMLKSLAGDDRVWIAHRADHSRNSRGDDGARARSGTPGVAAGLERDVQRRALRALAGLAQRDNFGVVPSFVNVKALADHPAGFHDHGSDDRIGMSQAHAASRKIKRAGHPEFVSFMGERDFLFHHCAGGHGA